MDDNTRNSCSICFDNFKQNNEVAKVKCQCKYYYHKECIKTWINYPNACCPFCRVKIRKFEHLQITTFNLNKPLTFPTPTIPILSNNYSDDIYSLLDSESENSSDYPEDDFDSSNEFSFDHTGNPDYVFDQFEIPVPIESSEPTFTLSTNPLPQNPSTMSSHMQQLFTSNNPIHDLFMQIFNPIVSNSNSDNTII